MTYAIIAATIALTVLAFIPLYIYLLGPLYVAFLMERANARVDPAFSTKVFAMLRTTDKQGEVHHP
jgi:riboflavin transporter FmnP